MNPDENSANPPQKEEWPGVSRAYDFVVPSYQLMLNRFEAADSRLASLLTTASSLTLAVPIFAKTVRSDISYSSPWFWVAMTIFGLITLVGLIGRLRGRITLPDPAILYSHSLRESEWEFQKNQIYYAGVNFSRNASAINIKGKYAIAITLLLLIEIGVLIKWLAG